MEAFYSPHSYQSKYNLNNFFWMLRIVLWCSPPWHCYSCDDSDDKCDGYQVLHHADVRIAPNTPQNGSWSSDQLPINPNLKTRNPIEKSYPTKACCLIWNNKSRCSILMEVLDIFSRTFWESARWDMELKEILTPRLLSVTEINLIGFILLSFLIYFKLTDIQTTYIKLSHCIQLH